MNDQIQQLQARITDLESQLYDIGASGEGQSIRPTAQDDAQLHCDVCGVECANPWHFSTETKRHKHACDACWDRMKIPGQVVELDHTPAHQQEPVAWRVHPFDYGVGSKGVYALTQMPEQVEMWNRKGWIVEPLYAAPQPTENLRCKSTQKRLATLWGYVKPQHLQPLTDEQMYSLYCEAMKGYYVSALHYWRNEEAHKFARAIEAAVANQPPRQPLTDDAKRLDWLMLNISGAEFRRIGIEYSGICTRKDIDNAIERENGITGDQ